MRVRPVLTREATAATLHDTDLFAGLDEPALHELAGSAVQRTYGRGQFLWYQGDPGDRLLVIASGLVKVLVIAESGDEVVLVTLGPHQTLGELAMLDQAPRSASVVAIEPTTVLMLPRSTVLALMSRYPAVLEAVLHALGQLVRRLTEQTSDLVVLDLGGRLAKLLLRLAAAPHGTDRANPDTVIDLGLSQSDLAAMVGATRQAVNKALQLLVARGLISVDGQVIRLLDVPGLRRRAGG